MAHIGGTMMTLCFLLSVLFIFYVYLGYPIILWVASLFFSRELIRKNYNGDISILLVVCNEEKNIANKLDNLLALQYGRGKVDIYIVDDASNDSTCEIIRGYGDQVKLIRSKGRKGKANGINLGMEYINTELVLMVDCRQRIGLDSLNLLSSWFTINSKMGAVSGELVFESVNDKGFSEGVDGYWKYEKFIRKSEAMIASVPGVSGALYMMRSSLFEPLPINTLLDDVQIPMACIKKGYEVVFDDKALAWDIPSDSVENEKVRKVRTLSGNYQLLFRFPSWTLPFGHPIWWQFFSHKIARLLAPFVAVTSMILSLYIYQEGIVYGLVYFTLALTTLLLLPTSIMFPAILKNKIVKLLSSFLMLNWFCVIAAYQYLFVSNSGSWKK